MKKIFSIAVLSLLTVFFASAQNERFVSTQVSKRNVVLEEYTGINCGYCPDGHRIANQIAADNPGRVFVLNVHTGGFSANTFTTQFGEPLASQTGLEGYPSGTINRHSFSGNESMALGRSDWESAASEIMKQTSPVNIAARGTLDWKSRELKITVQLYYTANESYSSNKLNIAVLQDNVVGAQAGGMFNPNQVEGSQYRHMHMLRHLITGQWGDEITTTTKGSFVEKTYTYTSPQSFGTPSAIAAKLEDLHFVAFVAEGKKEILTACQVEVKNINMPALNPRLDGLAKVDVLDCSNQYGASVTVKNVGSNPIVALNFEYRVGSGSTQTYQWTGYISSMSSQIINLPAFSIYSNTDQQVSAKIVKANGEAFESDEVSITLKKNVISADGPLVLKIKTDKYAEETSYALYNSMNSTIQESSSFSNVTEHTFNLNFPSSGCYRLEVRDDYSDGIAGGYVRLYASDGTLLFDAKGNSFTSVLYVMISVK